MRDPQPALAIRGIFDASPACLLPFFECASLATPSTHVPSSSLYSWTRSLQRIYHHRQVLQDGQHRYPAVSPGGETVRRVEGHRADADRAHLSPREGGELYVEVMRFANLTPGEEYARHRTSLEERFGPGVVTELREADLAGRPP